jgi:hypothetical protein
VGRKCVISGWGNMQEGNGEQGDWGPVSGFILQGLGVGVGGSASLTWTLCWLDCTGTSVPSHFCLWFPAQEPLTSHYNTCGPSPVCINKALLAHGPFTSTNRLSTPAYSLQWPN